MVNIPIFKRLERILFLLAAVPVILLSVYGCASGGGTEGTWGRSFSGLVNSDAGQPQVDAQVELLETGSVVTTDVDGLFSFERVELPEVPVTFRISGTSLDATVILEQALPQQDVKVALSIVVDTQTSARIDNVVVVPAAQTPAPTIGPTQAPAPTVNATATAIPMSTPLPLPGIPTATPTSTPTTTSTSTPLPAQPDCQGDVDGDRNVDLDDLLIVLTLDGTSQGQPDYNPNADVNSDGVINGQDVTIVQNNFGACD